MSKISIAPIQAGYRSLQAYNQNFSNLQTAFDNTLSRDGTGPNQMGSNLDMNSNRVINLPAPGASTDAARWIDVTNSLSTTGFTLPNPTSNDGKFLVASGGTYVLQQPFTVFQANTGGTVDAGSALQAWHDALPASGGQLYVPNGTYLIHTPVSFTKPVLIRGASMVGVIFTTDLPTGNVMTFAGSSSIENFSFTASVVRTAGYFVYRLGCSTGWVKNAVFQNYYIAIGQDNCVLDVLRDIQFNTPVAATVAPGGGAIQVGLVTQCGSCVYDQISTFANSLILMPTFGINFVNVDGPIIVNSEIIRHGIDLYITPGNGQLGNAIHCTNTFFDSATYGIVFAATGTGTIADCIINGCWTGNHSQSGVFIDSTGVFGLQIIGLQAFGNTQYGILCQFNCGLRVIGGVFRANSIGIVIASNVNNFAIIGATCGLANGTTGNTTGIFVGSGTSSNYTITDCDVTGNVTSISDGGTGTDKHVYNNPGYLSSNSGVASLTSALTSLVINHGLAATPPAQNIYVTPGSDIGTASYWWADTITSTQFTLHLHAAPGATVSFNWRASLAGAN